MPFFPWETVQVHARHGGKLSDYEFGQPFVRHAVDDPAYVLFHRVDGPLHFTNVTVSWDDVEDDGRDVFTQAGEFVICAHSADD
jgi:hypothetical protein